VTSSSHDVVDRSKALVSIRHSEPDSALGFDSVEALKAVKFLTPILRIRIGFHDHIPQPISSNIVSFILKFIRASYIICRKVYPFAHQRFFVNT
jgi:hypothetical protein